MGMKDLLFGPHTGWVLLGLFVAGLYGFAVRMTHRRASGGVRPSRTGEFQRVGLENGSERRATAELRPVADPARRSTVETRPYADAGRRSTVETRPAPVRGPGR